MEAEINMEAEIRAGMELIKYDEQYAMDNSSRNMSQQCLLHEKTELQNLNNRLAAYISCVRNLESEKSAILHENMTMKSLYDHELCNAKKLLDDTAKDNAKLEIDLKYLWEENTTLKTKQDKLQKELLIAENTARSHEARYIELAIKYSELLTDHKRVINEANELKNQNKSMHEQLEEFRKKLGEETLARVDLENTIQSLREELSFKDQLHYNIRSTRKQDKVEDAHEHLSEDSLEELREQYETAFRENREEIKMLYDAKIKNLQSTCDYYRCASENATKELNLERTVSQNLKSKNVELEAKISALNIQICKAEELFKIEQVRNADNITSLETELAHLRDEMLKQIQQYQDLMDVKVSLDFEIAAYDKLLKNEEGRLSDTQLHRFKRKRTEADDCESNPSELLIYSVNLKGMSHGDIEIVETDPKGRFVKLHNKGDKEVDIQGWQLIRYAGNRTQSFNFKDSVKVGSGADVTVWSSGTSVAHKPPLNIVMEHKKWLVSDNMKTLLFDAGGKEIAIAECKRQQISKDASGRRSCGELIKDKIFSRNLRRRVSQTPQRESSVDDNSMRGTQSCNLM